MRTIWYIELVNRFTGSRDIREKLLKIGKKSDFFENSMVHKSVHISFTGKQVAYSESAFDSELNPVRLILIWRKKFFPKIFPRVPPLVFFCRNFPNGRFRCRVQRFAYSWWCFVGTRGVCFVEKNELGSLTGTGNIYVQIF